MRIDAKVVVAKPVVETVTLVLSQGEAEKLRRMCYYNKTISKKFAQNPNGGRRKADDILSFASSLGNALKAKGIERF